MTFGEFCKAHNVTWAERKELAYYLIALRIKQLVEGD